MMKIRSGFSHATTSHHLGHPERARGRFTQSFLEDPTRCQEETVTPKLQG
ncbi:MAG: hypothetical protein J0M04_17560 [Verrucomicrobia bacterium]|nr:hypothetical protein [Verrucomicrobiota bacterium]